MFSEVVAALSAHESGMSLSVLGAKAISEVSLGLVNHPVRVAVTLRRFGAGSDMIAVRTVYAAPFSNPHIYY